MAQSVKLTINATDDNGNWDNTFISIYDSAVSDDISNEQLARNLFKDYCMKHVGTSKVLTHVSSGGFFIGATLFFADTSTYTWFKLKYE